MKKQFYSNLPLILVVSFALSLFHSIKDISNFEDFLTKLASFSVGSLAGMVFVIAVFETIWHLWLKD